MPDPSRFRIDRIDPAEQRSTAAWRRALAEFEPGEVLKREGGSAVYRARMMDRDVVVKVRELRTLGDRLKVALGAGRGRRHWAGAAWLMEHDIETARPYVLAIEHGGECSREWLVLEALPGKTLLQHMADRDLTTRDQHRLARAVGRQVSALHSAGRSNRDHKPSNLIVARRGDDFKVAIIDCVAIRAGKNGPVRMLHALAVEPTGLKILPRRTLLARVIHAMVEADFADHDPNSPPVRLAKWGVRRGFRDVVIESLQRHGDPTPRTNPLAGRDGALR